MWNADKISVPLLRRAKTFTRIRAPLYRLVRATRPTLSGSKLV